LTTSIVNKKIIDFLKNNPRYSYNAPTLYKMFNGKININTIRCELRRLHEQKKVVRETHGFYRIRIDAEALYYLEHPPTLLHGIMVSMKWNRKLQKSIHGITFDNLETDIKERLLDFGFKQTEGPNKKRLVYCFYFENDRDRLVTVTVHFNGRLDIYLNCSNHPVNFFEFRDILSYTRGMVGFLGPFVDARVVEFGEAKDFRCVRMSGCNEVSLRVFLNHWFRIYNKESLGVTRVEQHVRCDVPVSELLSLFENVFFPVGNGFVSVDTKEDVV